MISFFVASHQSSNNGSLPITSTISSVTTTFSSQVQPATIGQIQVVSQQGSTVTFQLSQLSTNDNGSQLTQVFYQWGDCQVGSSNYHDNSPQSHTYSVFNYGGMGSAWLYPSNQCQTSTIYAYVVEVQATYQDGKTLIQNYVLNLH